MAQLFIRRVGEPLANVRPFQGATADANRQWDIARESRRKLQFSLEGQGIGIGSRLREPPVSVATEGPPICHLKRPR